MKGILNTMVVSLSLMVSVLLISGCSSTTPPAQFSMKTDTMHTVTNPVKSPVLHKVHSVVVAYYGEQLVHANYPADIRTVYQLLTTSIEQQLTQTHHYRVMDKMAFQTALAKEAPDFNLFTASEKELRDVFAKVGRELGVHGVIVVGMQKPGKTANPIRQLGTLLTEGDNMQPANLTLTMIRSRTGEVLYEQNDNIQYRLNSGSLTGQPANSVMMDIDLAVKPLVTNMVTAR